MCQAHAINTTCCRSGNTISCYYQHLCSLRLLRELGHHTSKPLQPLSSTFGSVTIRSMSLCDLDYISSPLGTL